jgi:predicted acyl esterase
MVQIQSSWFPLVDLNPQTFTNIYKAERSQFHKAEEKIYHSGAAASVLRVNILPGQ